MRILTVLVVSVLALVLVSCGGSDSTELTDTELAWCGNVDDAATFNAIWDASTELEVDSIGNFMLDKAGIDTDVDPRELGVDDLTEAELEPLTAVGEEFDASEDMWLEYLGTEDGATACAAGYETVNG